MPLDTFPLLQDHTRLIRYNDTLYKMKIKYDLDIKTNRMLNEHETHHELEQMMRAVLYKNERNYPLKPIITPKFLVKPMKLKWGFIVKNSNYKFTQNGKTLKVYEYQFEFHVSENTIDKEISKGIENENSAKQTVTVAEEDSDTGVSIDDSNKDTQPADTDTVNRSAELRKRKSETEATVTNAKRQRHSLNITELNSLGTVQRSRLRSRQNVVEISPKRKYVEIHDENTGQNGHQSPKVGARPQHQSPRVSTSPQQVPMKAPDDSSSERSCSSASYIGKRTRRKSRRLCKCASHQESMSTTSESDTSLPRKHQPARKHSTDRNNNNHTKSRKMKLYSARNTDALRRSDAGVTEVTKVTSPRVVSAVRPFKQDTIDKPAQHNMALRKTRQSSQSEELKIGGRVATTVYTDLIHTKSKHGKNIEQVKTKAGSNQGKAGSNQDKSASSHDKQPQEPVTHRRSPRLQPSESNKPRQDAAGKNTRRSSGIWGTIVNKLTAGFSFGKK